MNSLQFAKLCLEKAEDKKGLDGVILELKGHSIIADYFVIITGTSDRHVKGIADEIQHYFKKQDPRILPAHMDGYQSGDWVILDYSDVIIHVLKKEAREFYDLEALWQDCKQL